MIADLLQGITVTKVTFYDPFRSKISFPEKFREQWPRRIPLSPRYLSTILFLLKKLSQPVILHWKYSLPVAD
jgi:hypothetical protein